MNSKEMADKIASLVTAELKMQEEFYKGHKINIVVDEKGNLDQIVMNSDVRFDVAFEFLMSKILIAQVLAFVLAKATIWSDRRKRKKERETKARILRDAAAHFHDGPYRDSRAARILEELADKALNEPDLPLPIPRPKPRQEVQV